MDAPTGPLWSQKQAIAYEVALEAINDVIAGYSEQIALEQTHPAPNTARITWLEMRSDQRSEEHTSELQSLMRISYAVFCLKNHIFFFFFSSFFFSFSSSSLFFSFFFFFFLSFFLF